MLVCLLSHWTVTAKQHFSCWPQKWKKLRVSREIRLGGGPGWWSRTLGSAEILVFFSSAFPSRLVARNPLVSGVSGGLCGSWGRRRSSVPSRNTLLSVVGWTGCIWFSSETVKAGWRFWLVASPPFPSLFSSEVLRASGWGLGSARGPVPGSCGARGL